MSRPASSACHQLDVAVAAPHTAFFIEELVPELGPDLAQPVAFGKLGNRVRGLFPSRGLYIAAHDGRVIVDDEILGDDIARYLHIAVIVGGYDHAVGCEVAAHANVRAAGNEVLAFEVAADSKEGRRGVDLPIEDGAGDRQVLLGENTCDIVLIAEGVEIDVALDNSALLVVAHLEIGLVISNEGVLTEMRGKMKPLHRLGERQHSEGGICQSFPARSRTRCGARAP